MRYIRSRKLRRTHMQDATSNILPQIVMVNLLALFVPIKEGGKNILQYATHNKTREEGKRYETLSITQSRMVRHSGRLRIQYHRGKHPPVSDFALLPSQSRRTQPSRQQSGALHHPRLPETSFCFARCPGRVERRIRASPEDTRRRT